MSFLDAIGDFFSHTVGSIFGGDDAPAREQQRPAHRTSASSPTGYDGPRSAGTAPGLDLDGAISAVLASRASGDPAVRHPGIDDAGSGSTPPPTNSRPGIWVYDAARPDGSGTPSLIGDDRVVASSGADNAKWAAANVSTGLDYFRSTFGRNGLDGAGEGVRIVVNDHTTGDDGTELFHGNAGFFRMPGPDGTPVEALHFGDGIRYEHAGGGVVDQYEMLAADDMVVHELTHGIIERETGVLGGTQDEAGAVGEALADVFAVAATRSRARSDDDAWRIGEGMYTSGSDYTAMRDIAHPDDPTAVHGLWGTVAEVESHRAADGSIEEHFASGVISETAYRMQRRLGWQPMEQLFYTALTDHTMGSMSFAETATSLRRASLELWGAGSTNTRVVDEELRAAGL